MPENVKFYGRKRFVKPRISWTDLFDPISGPTKRLAILDRWASVPVQLKAAFDIRHVDRDRRGVSGTTTQNHAKAAGYLD